MKLPFWAKFGMGIPCLWKKGFTYSHSSIAQNPMQNPMKLEEWVIFTLFLHFSLHFPMLLYMVWLIWNYLFSLFAYTLAYYLGESFNTLYIILSPFVNLIWIVSFWSISLTALTNSKKQKAGG